ncbi:MAG: PAS domain-containing sensor histidine kinase [Anaerolineae bacterium]|nr:PAS domain-containing sensor histidine kinase [Anaerolineae bacterium]
MTWWGWSLLLLAGALTAWFIWQAREVAGRAAKAEQEATRREAERAALVAQVGALRQRLAQVEAATHDALIVVDDAQHITALNYGGRALFSDVVGRSLIEIVRDADLRQAVADTLADHRRRTLTLTAALRTYRVHVTDGGATATLAFQDVTDLHRLQRARRDFVANISHELRTPLTSLGLLCDALLATTGDGDNGELVRTISSEVGALTTLVTDMLDLTQIEDGRLPLRLAPTQVTDLVEPVVSRLKPQAEQKGIAVMVEIETGIQALADPEKARRVLTNLLDNAFKYAYANSQVRITAQRSAERRADGGDILFTVADNGPGIAAADLPRVFERFFKADRARERGGGVGAGLGLAIARHLVEAHGGRIWATSVEGQGAAFHFTLPEA